MEVTKPKVPAVSIVMPTYKRPDMIKRAVKSVLEQTVRDWELIISDDEDPPGETWAYLQDLAKRDRRIRVLRNPGEHGQIPNNNFVLSQARAPWVKPLYDDDALKPGCLQRMLVAAIKKPGASVLICLADNYVDNELARPGLGGKASTLEYLSADDALLACYLQDLEVGTPVQCLVRREDIQAGILWENPGDMNSAFDTWWLYRLIARGGVLLLNEPLIDQHWGHETGTSEMQDNPHLMDNDIVRLKHLLYPMIQSGHRPPALSTVEQQARIMRAILRLRDRKFGQAIKLLAPCWNLSAWRYALSWLRNKRHMGRRPLVARDELWP
jgi:glycosyltransferase involved in cell wall biosynthesis